MKLILSTILIIFIQSTFAQSLFGTWNNSDYGTLTLNSNGEGSLDGIGFSFTKTASKLIATDENGENFYYTYKISNNQLILSGGIFNGTVVFVSANTKTINSINKSSSGTIDNSIVGTWCWTNASSTYTSSSSNSKCIVINGNGTYQYTYEGSISGYGGDYYGGSTSQSSDNGTWKLNGNTISIVSQNEGSQMLSFQKKNHPKTGEPMIVIDGEAYVTYYQRNPW
ncbi:MAG: hypothetical protein R2739_02695 [Chitinophagales bacterium]|nr:hypothetical protein [Bacteroidota bacterium]